MFLINSRNLCGTQFFFWWFYWNFTEPNSPDTPAIQAGRPRSLIRSQNWVIKKENRAWFVKCESPDFWILHFSFDRIHQFHQHKSSLQHKKGLSIQNMFSGFTKASRIYSSWPVGCEFEKVLLKIWHSYISHSASLQSISPFLNEVLFSTNCNCKFLFKYVFSTYIMDTLM